MRALFWISAGVIGYVYAGYPLLLGAWARLADRHPAKPAPSTVERWPSISIVLAARNEASRLAERVENLLQIAYPASREILVVSDGSTDGTTAVLRKFGEAVRVIEVPAGGKPLALNAGVSQATGEILVFADARQRFAADALVELIANFQDPLVGGVTGELVLDAEHQPAAVSSVGEGVGLYWRYEKWLRRNESLVWSTLGATGAIYAMRRPLWRPLPADTLLDDVLAPMRAVLDGWRIVFDDSAQAYDRASVDAAAEWRRKVRTLAGNYQVLAQEPRLLLPLRNPVWLQYVSHKVGRLAVPWALVGAFLASAVLAMESWFYAAVFFGQLVVYALAVFGGWAEAQERRLSAPVGRQAVAAPDGVAR